MTDRHPASDNILSSAYDAEVITPSDTVDLPRPTKAIYVGGSGDLTVVMLSGAVVTYQGVIAGFLPIRATRVNATNTTATALVAVY